MFDQQPTFSIDVPGFSQQKAQQSYGACILAGGSISSCGASAAQAGMPSTAIINPSSQGDDCKGKWNETFCYFMKGINNKDPFVNKVADEASAKSWFGDPSKIITAIVGLVFIAASLFLLRSPITVLKNVAGAS